ncbi:MAG: response regulator [Bacteroidetes bacterium]|nr:response regulator [Bacteroidota bacterium]
MKQSINILVVEDEIVIAQDIRFALEDVGYTVLGIARDYDGAIKAFDYELPDLLLLDITLKGDKTGIDVASYVRENFEVPFIFITSHANRSTLEQAKATRPNGYLVKPFNQDDLYTSIEVALYNFNESKVAQTESIAKAQPFKDSMFIKSSGVFQRLRYDDILYLEADGVYTNIYANNGKRYAERQILLEFEKQLDDSKFMRVHRSYIINLEKLDSLKQDQVIIGEHQVPLGRTHKEKLMKNIQ